jgi:Lrp/AsnC family leucine-responsive transcriptional regulator
MHVLAKTCTFSAVKNKLDAFDLKLLHAMQRNSRLTAEELAEKVSLSPSAVQRRLRRLRERKIIQGEVAIISPEAVGRTLTAIVQVTLDTDRKQVLERFQEAIRTAPEVMQGFYVTGETDFVLVVTATNLEEYEAFAHRFLSKQLHVKHFRTNVVMRRVKIGLTVPI